MPRLEDLELNIKQVSTRVQPINRLADALKKLSSSATNLGEVSTAMRGIGAALSRVNVGEVSKLTSFASAMARFTVAAQKADPAAKGIVNIGAAINRMSDSINVEKLEKIADAVNKIRNASGITNGGKGGRKSSMAKLVEASKAMETPLETEAVGQTQETEAVGEAAQTASSKVEVFRKAIEKLKNGLSKAGKTSANFAKNLIRVPWENFKRKIQDSFKGVTQLGAALKRIAMYRFLRTLIKEVTQGLSEGIKHLYEWSRLVGNNFADSMDSLASSAHYLRDAFAAMVSPILDALAPAVEILVDKFVDLMNVVNQFLATITGASSWRKAVRQQDKYVEETDKAAAAQKRLNHQLMAFDELNNLTTTNPSGRGRGDDDGIDEGHFQEVEIPDWAKKIKEAIDGGNWYEAGSLLGKKLNSIVDDWDASGWGKNLGQKIQNAISAYNGFMDSTNWTNIGKKLADFLNNAIGSINGQDLGKAIVQKFNAAIGFLAGFTRDFDWKAAGEWLADVIVGAFVGLDWGTLGTLVKNLATGLLNMIKAGITKLNENKSVIFKKIGNFFSNLGWDGFKSVVKIGLIVKGLKSLFSSAFGNGGLINKVKSLAATLLDKAGLTASKAGITATIAIGLVWAASGIIENIKKYGVDRGLWKSISVFNNEATDEMIVKLGLDTSDFVDSFNDMIGVFGPVFKALGIEVPEITLGKKEGATVKRRGEGLNGNGKKTSDVPVFKNTGLNIPVTFTAKNLNETLEQVDKLNKALTNTAGEWKLKVTADLKLKPKNGSYYTLEPAGGYASGGYPDAGDLFLANEAGPELVGTMNGKTAVASNNEITGIADAVYSTGADEATLLREQNSLLRQILAKGFNVNLAPNVAAGRWVSQAQTAYARATGG